MKMSNLYQLTNNYETVLNMLYDEDADEQMILDTLEAIEGEIEDKADNYAKIIKELEAKQNARKVLRSPLTTIFLIINSLAVKSSLSSLTIFILNIFLPNV